MDNDSVALILLIVLIVSGFLLILIRLSKFGNDFGRKKQYLLNEMYRGGLQRSLLAQRTPLPLPLPYSVRDRAQRNEGVSRILPPRKARRKGKALGRSYAHPRPSMLAICICSICLCGASWAWFTASTSTGTTKQLNKITSRNGFYFCCGLNFKPDYQYQQGRCSICQKRKQIGKRTGKYVSFKLFAKQFAPI